MASAQRLRTSSEHTGPGAGAPCGAGCGSGPDSRPASRARLHASRPARRRGPPRRQRSGHRSRLNKSARRPPVRLGSRVPSGAFDGDAAVRVRSRGVSSQQWCRVVVRSWLVVVPSAPSPPSRPVAAPGPAPGATCTSPRPWRPLCALRRSPSARARRRFAIRLLPRKVIDRGGGARRPRALGPSSTRRKAGKRNW